MDLRGKLAIVTGAGSGVGQAVAWSLAREEMTVVAVGRSAKKLQETVERSPGLGPIHPCVLDVSDRSAVFAAVDEIQKRHGTPWLVVNNAGINIRDRAIDVVRPADWDAVVATNLTGAFNVTQAILPAMIAARDGVVIAISSIAGLRPLPLAGAAYAASKYGLNGYIGTLAREAAPYGVRASIICPGEVATPILEQRPKPVSQEERDAMLQPQDVADAVLFIARLPKRAHVAEIVLKPLVQDYG